MNDLKILDLTTLFWKLEEHAQELTCLKKHEKENEKKIKNEKDKDRELEKKSIALKASSSKSLINEQSYCEISNDKNFDDEEIDLFVKSYHRYIRKNGVKHSD